MSVTQKYSYSGVHLNGNLLCAIDVETTGLEAGFHDITQIAIIPVSPTLEMSKHFPFFHTLIRPRRPENIDPNVTGMARQKIVEAINHGLEPETAEERLREWFHGLKLPHKKLIVPLGHNYCFDRDFIRDWLGGPLSYGEFFRSDHRDTMQMALMINDMYDAFAEPVPFAKYSVGALCSRLELDNTNPHDALNDASITIQIYKKLLYFKDSHRIV